MSSITSSRHNSEHGQPKPQLGGGAQPTTTTKPQGGAGKGTTTGPTPQGGRGGGIPWGGGGGGAGGVWQPCIIYTCMCREHRCGSHQINIAHGSDLVLASRLPPVATARESLRPVASFLFLSTLHTTIHLAHFQLITFLFRMLALLKIRFFVCGVDGFMERNLPTTKTLLSFFAHGCGDFSHLIPVCFELLHPLQQAAT